MQVYVWHHVLRLNTLLRAFDWNCILPIWVMQGTCSRMSIILICLTTLRALAIINVTSKIGSKYINASFIIFFQNNIHDNLQHVQYLLTSMEIWLPKIEFLIVGWRLIIVYQFIYQFVNKSNAYQGIQYKHIKLSQK